MERNIKIGDEIVDNDPRMPGRVLVVTGFHGMSVVASARAGSALHKTRISLSRIFTDGKPRRTGWSLVTDQPHERRK